MSGTINTLALTASAYAYRQVNAVGWMIVLICAVCGMLIIAGLRLLLTSPSPRPAPLATLPPVPPPPA
jgi:hypothetical protein